MKQTKAGYAALLGFYLDLRSQKHLLMWTHNILLPTVANG